MRTLIEILAGLPIPANAPTAFGAAIDLRPAVAAVDTAPSQSRSATSTASPTPASQRLAYAA